MVIFNLLTTVDGQEEGSIDTVVDEWGLPVQRSCCVNSPIDGVNIQPACGVLVHRVPEEKIGNNRIHSN